MKKHIIIELIIWIVTFAISFSLIYPIVTKIDYLFDFFTFIQLVLIITFFRWIVLFDRVVLFENTWIKMISIPLLIVSAFILVNTGQHIILELENQKLSDIVKDTNYVPFMSQLDMYNFYNYIHNLTIFTTWISGGISFILAIRVIASYIGYKSDKLSKYLTINK